LSRSYVICATIASPILQLHRLLQYGDQNLFDPPPCIKEGK
jgi:hypothetical protein